MGKSRKYCYHRRAGRMPGTESPGCLCREKRQEYLYAESSPWSNRIISTVSEYVQKNPKLALYAEHMNTLMIDNDTILGEFKNMISQKYEHHRPRLLIL